MKECARVFREGHPEVAITLQAAGSRECASRLYQGESADVIALADPAIFADLTVRGIARGSYLFATDRIVLAFDDFSRWQDQINGRNWMEVLLADQVTFGRSDQDLDPCGYRTLMVWQMAEAYYHRDDLYRLLDERCTPDRIVPKSIDLVELVAQGRIDYAFVYSSVAKQFNLKHITLPREIDLSSPAFADRYARAIVVVDEGHDGHPVTVRGAPIEFAIGIHCQAEYPALAWAFLDLVHGREGERILEENGLIPC